MKKRHVIFISLILMIVLGSWLIQPVLPVVQVPGEVLVKWPEGSPFYGPFGQGLTNTFVATIISYAIVIGMVLGLRARSRTSDEVPTGFYNFFEMVIEGAYNFVQGIAGKWSNRFFPFFMSFTILILVANWLELVPGVDSIGIWENLPHHRAEVAAEEAAAAGMPMTEAEIHALEEELAAQNIGDLRRGLFLLRAPTGPEGEKPDDADWTIVPFVRVPATDLNFTLALAFVSVISIQYYGFKSLGLSYLTKFFNFSARKTAQNPLGAMDPIVGILELISELARIISFAFRLFGVIFAGQVLLFVIGFLLPVANLAVYGLEFFVGAVQALVFAMLTLIFMSIAVQPHHGEEDHH